MNKKYYITILLLALISGLNCNTTEPPVNNGAFILSLADVSCTEALVNINANGLSPVKINLYNGNTLTRAISLNSNVTTIYIDSLMPNKNYQLQAQYKVNNQTVESNKLIVQTLDTTSNNFTWQTFTFGDPGAGSSALYDVAILDENDIWAVGEIYMNDSTGKPNPTRYNLAVWDGNNWTVKRVPYYYQGQPFYNPIQTVFAFSANDIWFAGNGVIHWNGNQYNPVPLPSNVWGQDLINKIWGTSSNDLFIVGNGGSIAHYQNGIWQRIESGTNLDLFDIYSNNGNVIYVSGGDFFNNLEGVLSKGDSNSFDILKEGKDISANELFNPYFEGIANTVWVSNQGIVYFGGNLLYRYLNGRIELVKSFLGNYFYGNINGKYFGFISQIRGPGENDIILVDEGNTVRHFNGIRWQQLGMPYNFSSEYTWLAVAIKGDKIVTVGQTNTSGVVMILKSN